MSEQTANGRNANGHRFRLYEVIIGVVLTAMFALLTVMFTMLFASVQQLSNRVDALDHKMDEKVAELDRKMEALDRKVDENTLILVKMQTTLDVIANGLNIRVEPKEQAGPATTPSPSEKLATKDP